MMTREGRSMLQESKPQQRCVWWAQSLFILLFEKKRPLHGVSYVYYRQQIKLDCVIKIMQCTVRAAIVLAVCESFSWPKLVAQY
jgi:hypothetical protein